MSGLVRFFAPTSSEALRKLKAELGPDALVISNKSVEGGVEILAMPPEAVQEAPRITPSPMRRDRGEPPPRPAAPGRAYVNTYTDEDDDFTVSLSEARRNQAAAQAPRPDPVRRNVARMAAYAEQNEPPWPPVTDAPLDEGPITSAVRKHSALFSDDMLREPVRRPAEKPVATRPEPREPEIDPQATARMQALEEANARMASELSAIRNLLERQLAGFAWGAMSDTQPVKAQLMGELLEAGFSSQLARELVERTDASLSLTQARAKIRALLDANLRVLSTDDDLVSGGGVFALIGPTGVGKTTTTAKLAARCVVRYGQSQVALITSDNYRIGAVNQLGTLGRLLGVPVHEVRDAIGLRETLAQLRGKHMILIDTIGMSQRDRMLAEQNALFNGSPEVRRILVLNATNRGDTLDEVVRAYRNDRTVGCIISKVDEAASLAPIIDVVVRHRLTVCYVANGQRVPEDMHLPNRTYLLHRALKLAPDGSPFRIGVDEAGMMMTAGGFGV